LLFFKH